MSFRYCFSVVLISFLLLCGCGNPKNVTVSLEAPLTVEKGDEFVIVATVDNSASGQQTLVSLDIGDAYLDGIAIIRTEPDHQEATHVPIDNTMSYVFNIPVGPGKRTEVRLYAKAVKRGDYHSEIDFCINSDYLFLSKAIRTVVE